jgi:hypothetical protein
MKGIEEGSKQKKTKEEVSLYLKPHLALPCGRELPIYITMNI